MITFFVNGLGVGLIAATIWWFWIWTPRKGVAASNGHIALTVDNGTYTPALIDMHAGDAITLDIVRKDASPCSEFFIIDGLNISVQLPMNKPYQLVIEKPEAGEYAMHCQMNMYQGTLRVR